MAISDINTYAHLTDADVEALGHELDAIRREIEADRGLRDVRYLHRTIKLQRFLELSGRVVLLGSNRRSLWLLGTTALGLAKIIENMELGHNVMHGQWDWMNDPEVHSTTYEWDMVCASPHWKHSHNYIHHKYTNVLGMDDDVGYKVLRVTRDEPWAPRRLFQPISNLVLASTFEWGIGLHDIGLREIIDGEKPKDVGIPQLKLFGRKIIRQVGKDYVLYPALTGPNFFHTLTANATANLIRNLWAYVVIFCGHFPDGAEKFTIDTLEHETQGQWYLRQMLGSANFHAGPVMAFMSGNLCYQIEHHLFPDLPSNRLAEISVRVQQLCEKYDLPYTTGSLPVQYLKTLRTINKLALPDQMLHDTADDAPETASERRFAALPKPQGLRISGGLKTAIAQSREQRRQRKVRR
ncbi:acyl-CoA desaturase [Gordonia sp. (in: high G+C Gram-positive bacteria)]|uniref:fatty acid desaturase family protein n=1 Tax=Gordonia sp. (in: high G+C Gram-positive bacteria) TaxID=84139 RepID=UPI001DEF79DC|nr:acyl-CoA desaturase [Gordonia sp. (in: high G+C Gram-positive bacteria)]MCB1296870.1 acyl-CoA desaturase [Gordonia sp. (in: high G+C Gram-positive bacteria)]HMS74089.1 acyl-CoA desaturase [Gordonia sp. (in: high G+C Gram-positive bacteria)]HQV20216.1 acyl-CoA desaturase [Gordonia sp. (in: high G+C Gram-positive bacteria)]